MTKGLPHSYEISEEEADRIVELRKLLSDLQLSGEQREDAYLLRWLRARNLDVPKAEEMLRKSLAWRKENDIDTLLEREKIPQYFLDAAPVAHCGVDRDGYLLFLVPMGRHDVKSLLDSHGVEMCKKFNVINMETICKMLRDESQKQNRKITQIVEILDMEGYSYRQMSSKMCRDFMISMQQMMDSNYPELLRHAVIINAPKIFAVLFAMLKPFIPQNTLDKLEVYGPDENKWKKAIAARFPLEQIPKHWGGQMEGKDEYCSGHPMWIQGPKDMKSFLEGMTLDEIATAGFTSVTINARDKLTKDFEISENAILEWKFKTENYDIGFQIICDGDEEIFPYSRVNAHNSLQEGQHKCQRSGRYSFIFDNSFSLIKGKTLVYKISVVEPSDADENEFQECPEF